MKKLIIVYLAVSLIGYISGLSSLARTRIFAGYGLRAESFAHDSKCWHHLHYVYATGILNVHDTNNRTIESSKKILCINLDSDPNSTDATVFDGDIPAEAVSLKNVSVTYGSDARTSADEHKGEIYSVSTTISGTSFLVDAREGRDPRVYRIDVAPGFKPTPESNKRMPFVTVFAHLVDFASAPFQLLYVLLIILIFPSFN